MLKRVEIGTEAQGERLRLELEGHVFDAHQPVDVTCRRKGKIELARVAASIVVVNERPMAEAVVRLDLPCRFTEGLESTRSVLNQSQPQRDHRRIYG